MPRSALRSPLWGTVLTIVVVAATVASTILTVAGVAAALTDPASQEGTP